MVILLDIVFTHLTPNAFCLVIRQFFTLFFLLIAIFFTFEMLLISWRVVEKLYPELELSWEVTTYTLSYFFVYIDVFSSQDPRNKPFS